MQIGLTKKGGASLKWGDVAAYVDGRDAVLKNELSCPEPMTVAELSSIRGSSGLKVGCKYIITDYAYNTDSTLQVDALVFTAVAKNRVSRLVDIVSPSDGDNSLTGVIDSIGGKLTEVMDSKRNNTVKGNANITSFPWWSPKARNITAEADSTLVLVGSFDVDGLYLGFKSTLATDDTSELIVRDSYIRSGSSLGISGGSKVRINQSEISTNSVGAYDSAVDSVLDRCSFSDECYFGDTRTGARVTSRGIHSHSGYWRTHGGTTPVEFRWSTCDNGFNFNVDLSTAQHAIYRQLRMSGADALSDLTGVPAVANASRNF